MTNAVNLLPSMQDMLEDLPIVWANDKNPITAAENILDYLLPEVRSLEISSEKSLNRASAAYSEIRRFRLKVDDWKKANKAHYDREAKRLTDPLLDAENELKEKMLSYEDSFRKSHEEFLKEAHDFFGIEMQPSMKSVTETSSVKISTKEVKKWRLSDFSQIPDEFLMVNEKAVEKAIKEGRIVPGIEIYTEEKTTIKRI